MFESPLRVYVVQDHESMSNDFLEEALHGDTVVRKNDAAADDVWNEGRRNDDK